MPKGSTRVTLQALAATREIEFPPSLWHQYVDANIDWMEHNRATITAISGLSSPLVRQYFKREGSNDRTRYRIFRACLQLAAQQRDDLNRQLSSWTQFL